MSVEKLLGSAPRLSLASGSGTQPCAHLLLAYWLSARLGQQWRALGEKGEVPRLLRQMQTIQWGRSGEEAACGTEDDSRALGLERLAQKLDFLKLFAQPLPGCPCSPKTAQEKHVQRENQKTGEEVS